MVRGRGWYRGEPPIGWIAGCSNPVRGAGPPTDCIVCPRTFPLANRAAAVREWRKILTPRRNHQAPCQLDAYRETAFAAQYDNPYYP